MKTTLQYCACLLSTFLALLAARPAAGAGGHTNKAHYTFITTNIFAADVSSNGNNVSLAGSSGGNYYITNTAKEGPFAASFITNGPNSAAYFAPPTNLLSTFAGSFSLSLWLNTTDSVGGTNDSGAFSGAGVFSLQYNGGTNADVIPIALTGGKVAFLTGGSPNHTLHSATSVNSGNYTHVVVTREQANGQKKIYVNGALEATGTGTTIPLNKPDAIRVGANFNFNGLKGLVDDIQIYSGVLSAAEVAQMYTNAGVIIANTTNIPIVTNLANALDNTNLTWETDGAADWFYQTNVTHDGEDAASSGAIDEFEVSRLQATVPTNGQVSFYWKVSSLQDFDYLYFYINDEEKGFITGDIDWTPKSYEVETGDILRWEYVKDEAGSDGADRGWVDEVSFTTGTLAEALDTTNLLWSTDGDATWHFQTAVKHDGVDAAVSGTIDAGQSTYVETAVAADGEISFYWKVSSQTNVNVLYFEINGNEQDTISGEVDWSQQTYAVSAGDTLRWTYYKDDVGNSGDDLAWLDEVGFTAEETSISVGLRFTIQRELNANSSDGFLVFPFLTSVSVPAVTEHRVVSPTGSFSGTTSGSGAGIYSTLAGLINECTNTNGWKLYINKDHPSQRIYTFSVSFSGLTSNLLTSPVIYSPTNGATDVPTNSVFHWSGPAGYSTVFPNILWSNSPGGNATLAGTATNWPSPPTLNLGTNRLNVEYRSNNATQAIFTTPVGTNSNPIDGWTTETELKTIRGSIFTVVSASAPLAAQLTNVNSTGGNFAFSFQTQAGKSHTILASTNLSTTNWVVLTNFTGNGSLQPFNFPATNPPARFFRVLTQ